MISIVNPWQYESTTLNNSSDYLLNTTFNNECIDVSHNYECIETNNIGNYHPNYINNHSSIEFDGTTNFIEFNSIKCLEQTTNLAWGGWILPIQSNKKQYLLYSKNGLTMFINEDNKLYIKLYTYHRNHYRYAIFISKDPILINEWNYIICLYDFINSKHIITVYINNCTLDGTVTCGLKYPHVQGFNKIYLGYKKDNYYYKGLINKFFIKSNYCIQNLFENLSQELPGPSSHWNICHFKDTKTLIDITGTNNGTIYKDVFKLNFGKDGQYIEFNSASLSQLQDSAFSIALSIYLNKVDCQNKEYVIFSSLVYEKCEGFSITYVKGDTSYIKYKLRILNKDYTIISPIVVKMTTWNNIVITYNGLNCMQMYHNDTQIGIVSDIQYGSISELVVPTYLGGTGSHSFPGIINNIKVFNRLLANFEIKKCFC